MQINNNITIIRVYVAYIPSWSGSYNLPYKSKDQEWLYTRYILPPYQMILAFLFPN